MALMLTLAQSRPFQQLAITSQNDIRMLDLTDLGSCERLLTFNGFSSSGRRELLIFLQQYYLHHDHLGNDARAPTEYSSTDLEAAPRSIGNSAIVGPILAPSKHPSAAETITSRALRNTSGNKSRYHSYSRSKTPSHTHLSKVSAAQDVENSGNDIKTAHEAEMGTSSCDVAEQEILSASTAVSTAERSSDETTGEASHNIKNVVDTVALAWS